MSRKKDNKDKVDDTMATRRILKEAGKTQVPEPSDKLKKKEWHKDAT